MTATMLQMQRKLDDTASKPLFVSISIDPDFDTAARLGAYADRFGADWTFLTGERADVLDVLRAFSAWRGNKSNHEPLLCSGRLAPSAGRASRAWRRPRSL